MEISSCTAVGGLVMVGWFVFNIFLPSGGVGVDIVSIISSIFGFAGAIPDMPSPDPEYCNA